MWFAIPFWQRVLGAFAAGMLIGGLAPEVGVALKPLGDLFIKAIKMLVAPLIFCAIVSAITDLNDGKKIRATGCKNHWFIHVHSGYCQCNRFDTGDCHRY